MINFFKYLEINKNWSLFKKTWRFLVSTTALFLAIFLTLIYVDVVVLSEIYESFNIIYLLFTLVSFLIVLLLILGFTRIVLDLLSDKKVQRDDLFSQSSNLPDFFVATSVYVVLGIIGIFLLIVPGVYFITRYYFYGIVLIDKGYGPIESLKYASRLSKGFRWQIFVLLLLLISINIFGVLLLGLGILVSLPISILVSVNLYKKLSDRINKEDDGTLIRDGYDKIYKK